MVTVVAGGQLLGHHPGIHEVDLDDPPVEKIGLAVLGTRRRHLSKKIKWH